jgi:TolB-like protein
MVRSLSSATRLLAAGAALSLAAAALPAAVHAQADGRPVVVVFPFDNNAFGPGHADYDGLGKGVQDLLITDLASNAKIRLVDRARLNDLLQEQNLVKSGAVDNSTAIRLGHMLGAQYAVTGGFITDGKSTARIDAHVIDMETSQISNPQSVTGKTDDVLGLIGQLSSKVSNDVNLAPKPGAGRRVGSTGGADAPAQSGAPAMHETPASKAAVETFAKPVNKPEGLVKVKLDAKTLLVYSDALDQMDKKNVARAKQLLEQVLDKYPSFEPAQNQLEKMSH